MSNEIYEVILTNAAPVYVEAKSKPAAIKAAYEACWAPALEALHRQGALKADPVTARLFILGALNWSVQWFNPRGALSLDELTEQALDLFLGGAA